MKPLTFVKKLSVCLFSVSLFVYLLISCAKTKHPAGPPHNNCAPTTYGRACCGAPCLFVGPAPYTVPQDTTVVTYTVLVKDFYYKPLAIQVATDNGDTVFQTDITNYWYYTFHPKKGTVLSAFACFATKKPTDTVQILYTVYSIKDGSLIKTDSTKTICP